MSLEEMIVCNVPPGLHLTSLWGSAGLSWLMAGSGKEPRLSGEDSHGSFTVLSFYAYSQGLAPGVESADCLWKASVSEQASFLRPVTETCYLRLLPGYDLGL